MLLHSHVHSYTCTHYHISLLYYHDYCILCQAQNYTNEHMNVRLKKYINIIYSQIKHETELKPTHRVDPRNFFIVLTFLWRVRHVQLWLRSTQLPPAFHPLQLMCCGTAATNVFVPQSLPVRKDLSSKAMSMAVSLLKALDMRHWLHTCLLLMNPARAVIYAKNTEKMIEWFCKQSLERNHAFAFSDATPFTKDRFKLLHEGQHANANHCCTAAICQRQGRSFEIPSHDLGDTPRISAANWL